MRARAPVPSPRRGKQRSRRNAVRHGLTAETVIGALEDAEDYKLFEAAITADFVPQTAVERELVLRLASLLWRLRRATSIETGMIQNSTEGNTNVRESAGSSPEPFAAAVLHIRSLRPADESEPTSGGSFKDTAQGPYSSDDPDDAQTCLSGDTDTISTLARRFLRLAADDKGAFERLGRYETALWRQVCQTVFMLEMLRRQNLDVKWLPRSSHPGNRKSFLPFALARR